MMVLLADAAGGLAAAAAAVAADAADAADEQSDADERPWKVTKRQLNQVPKEMACGTCSTKMGQPGALCTVD
jgi:hypothetical protein